MVAQDFLLDSQVRAWLAGFEPAWTLLTFESLQALQQVPSATWTAIRISHFNSAASSGRAWSLELEVCPYAEKW